jgi:RNA polymerase sigma factor (sigma-70 family)
MAKAASSTLVGYLRCLLAAWKDDARPDAELLAEFAERGDERAFTTLVGRHGLLVWGTCLRQVRDPHAAEDAFQATFLALAQKAGRLRLAYKASLSAWLHKVARRQAILLRMDESRRREYEQQTTTASPDAPEQAAEYAELCAVFDEELERLPEKYRLPLLLCQIQGRPYAEVARELGCSITTVYERMVHGQELLRKRLTARGLSLAAGSIAVLFATGGVNGAVPAAMSAATVAAAVAWAREGLKASDQMAAMILAVKLWLGKLKFGILALGAGLLLIAGPSACFLRSVPPANPSTTPVVFPDARELPPTGAVKDRENATEMVVAGRVLDGAGRPVPHAEITAVARRPFRIGDFGLREDTLRVGRADAEGRFHVRVPADFPSWYPDRKTVLVAAAPGLPPATQAVPISSGHGPIELRLTKGSPIRGKVLDPDGNPAVGVKVAVVRLGDTAWEPVQGRQQTPPSFWPAPVQSDERGEFVLPGLGYEQNVWLQFQDDRFALTTELAAPSEEKRSYRLAPARLLTGRVLAGDTGRPLAYARLAVYAGDWDKSHHDRHTALTSCLEASRTIQADALDGRADAEGCFRLRLPSAEVYRVDVFPPENRGYLALTRQIHWDQGTTGRAEEFRLPPGIELHGRVIEAGDGKPVVGAYAYFVSLLKGNPFFRRDVFCDRQTFTTTSAEGTFRLVVPPGSGTLAVYGPRWEYVSQVADPRSMIPGPGRPHRYYSDSRSRMDFRPDCQRADVVVKLRRGLPASGQMTGPDGRLVSECILVCCAKVTALRNGVMARLPARDGRFTLPGCEPGHTYPVMFLDARNQLGAVAEIASSRTASSSHSVHLKPCGRAQVRVLGPDGRPVAGCPLEVRVLLEPDTVTGDAAALATRSELADSYPVPWIDSENYARAPVTDEEGRATLPALVPGARYYVKAFGDGVSARSQTFCAQSSETIVLPDLTLPRPQQR